MNRRTADTALPGGLRVLAALAPRSPLAELRLVIPYARSEPALTAAQELLAACLGTGTRGRTRQGVADRAADLGAEFSTIVTAESLILSVSVLAPGLPGALGLLAELLLEPRYREDEVALAQRRAAAAPRVPAPRVRLRRAALAHAFGPHPLTGEGGGTAALLDLMALSSDDLYALHTRAVVPAGATLVVLADAEPHDVLRLVRERLGAWTGDGPSGLALPRFARSEPRPGRLALTADAGEELRPGALVLAAGPYLTTSGEEIRGAGGPVRLTVRCRPRLAGEPGLARVSGVVRRVLGYYERLLGVACPYPKYDVVFAPGLGPGAMQLPGTMLVSEGLLQQAADPGDDFGPLVLAHEVAHLWFGCLVEGRWWDDLWLAEGMASYLAPLAGQDALGLDAVWAGFSMDGKARACQADQAP
ncbi:MAG: hypothetical protein LBV78_09730, partial [Kitasatospora sp.]|nr:hypothetical protein [Kitasatospora sp.]